MTITTLQEGDAPLTGDRQAPVAAVMVFDASPRMAYRRENRTRLQQAQEMADAVVREMPFDSEVAVMDSRGIRPVFSQDLSAARKALERCRSHRCPALARPTPEIGPATARTKPTETPRNLPLYRSGGRRLGMAGVDRT